MTVMTLLLTILGVTIGLSIFVMFFGNALDAIDRVKTNRDYEVEQKKDKK